MAEFVFPVEFISPIWTGGSISGQTDRIHETGLIGGMRWWFEAFMRSMNKPVCSPGQGVHHILDARRFNEQIIIDHRQSEATFLSCEQKILAACGLCPACQIFGATGWAKTFSLSINPIEIELQRPLNSPEPIIYPPDYKDSKGYVLPEGWIGQTNLTITPRRPIDEPSIKMLLGILFFISHYAGIGAKTNSGYGLFSLINSQDYFPRVPGFGEFITYLINLPVRIDQQEDQYQDNFAVLPNLKFMFFSEVCLNNIWTAEDFVNFKHHLREQFRKNLNETNDRYYLVGKLEEGQGSKVKAGYYYSIEKGPILRLWGWIPDVMLRNITRTDALGRIHDLIKDYGKEIYWYPSQTTLSSKEFKIMYSSLGEI